MGFWNKTNIMIGTLAIITLLSTILINGLNVIYLSCSIALFTAFISILSTLYSNYKSDLRIIINKRHEIYPKLTTELKTIPLFKKKELSENELIHYEDYQKLYEIITSFKESFDFIYCSDDVKKIINSFIEDNNKLKISQEDKNNNRELSIFISNYTNKYFPILKNIQPLCDILKEELDSKKY